MNIVVCVKQVPDDEVRISLADGAPDTGNVSRVVNVFDRYAVEAALRFCEKNGGEVTVITLGDEAEVRPAMVQLLAAGARHAYVGSPAPGDEGTTAEALKQLIGRLEEEGMEFGLILCGKESTDEASSQVGAILAEKMGLPLVTNVVCFELLEGGLKARKETDDGYEFYKVVTPAVFTVTNTGEDLRCPSIKRRLAAKKAGIPVIPVSAGSASVKCVGYEECQTSRKGIKVIKEDEAEAVAKAIEMLMADHIL